MVQVVYIAVKHLAAANTIQLKNDTLLWDVIQTNFKREISDQSSAYYQLSSTATTSDDDTGPMDVYMIFLDSKFWSPL